MFDSYFTDDDEEASRQDAPGFQAALRIRGAALDPDFITQQLGVAPTSTTHHGTERGDGAAAAVRWEYALQLPPGTDLGDGLDLLLARVPNDATLWQELADAYTVEVHCELRVNTVSTSGHRVLHETTMDAAVLERLAHLRIPLRLVLVHADADDEPAE